MCKKYFLVLIPLLALCVIGIFSGDVYSLGHYGIGGSVADCNICHDFASGYYNSPSQGNLRWVRSPIVYPSVISPTVYFVSFTGAPNSGILADDTAPRNGPCEVCHTTTSHYRNTAGGSSHFPGTNCTTCHPHFLDDITNYFEPRFVGNQSHLTHFTDPKGPQFQIKRPSDFCTYYCHSTSDFSLFNDGQPKATTTVCNPCHSMGGAFNGVTDATIGAKPNWEDAIYDCGTFPCPPNTWPYHLKDGKEDWCAGCHDAGTSVVDSISAPNVMGDNVNYGYNVSGHGRNPLNYIRCDDCHDVTAIHTDADARTYSASSNNYKDAYRLSIGLTIPKGTIVGGESHYELCLDCHVWSDVIGPFSGFRDDRNSPSERNLHYIHVGGYSASAVPCWDSDWKCVVGSGDCSNQDDSSMSCTACHNVHGSPCLMGGNTVVPCPNPPKVPMIRHGELISTPGTTNKVPALRFNWYDGNNVPTTDYNASRWGGVLCGPPEMISYNYVCWGCHTLGEVKYYRVPGGPDMVTVNTVWTTDWSDTPKTTFAPGAQIRYHASFTISGPNPTYFMKTNGKAQKTSGTAWSTTLAVQTETLAPGTYERIWDKTIPASASSGSNAKVTVTSKMRIASGQPIISENSKTATFRIQ